MLLPHLNFKCSLCGLTSFEFLQCCYFCKNADRPASAANSEGKQSKNVSFDDDVTVIVADQQEDKVDDSDQIEQVRVSTPLADHCYV